MASKINFPSDRNLSSRPVFQVAAQIQRRRIRSQLPSSRVAISNRKQRLATSSRNIRFSS